MANDMPTGPIIQQPWQPSVVEVGHRITGTCVTSGRSYTGLVAKAVSPIRTPDCGGYRYQLTNTGIYYASGNPVEPTVYAESWASTTDVVDITTITAGTRVEAVPAGTRVDGSPITRTIRMTVDRTPWYSLNRSTVVLADRTGVTAVLPHSIHILT